MSRAIAIEKPNRAVSDRVVAAIAAVVVAFPLGFGVAKWTTHDHTSPVRVAPVSPISTPSPITGDVPCHIGHAC